MFTHLYRQSISCILSSVLLGNVLYAGGVVVDTTAAQKYQAQMDTTANGIPLINIVKPDTGGLSHNKFSDFNINPSGLILNNATSAVQTQLGGYVQGNNNLGTTPARVILNEVTGTNRSYLQGYGEVAGAAADVIVANPNGITVNGGGFINTPHATLTTGTPEFSGSTLSGFHVQRGDILIEGAGLNADNTDRVDLYTKALQLNAQIYAKKLDVVTGENHISTDGTVTSDNVTGTKEFSIDSSALGGIYANVIRLVGTDKGVGVNLPPITYASDSLELSADGKIVLASAYATNAINLTSAHGDISLKNDLATDSLTLAASKTFTNTGSISVNNASLHADTFNNEFGATLAAKKMDAAIISDLTNAGELRGEDVTLSTQNLYNSSSMVSNTMDLNLRNSLSNTGSLSASNRMNLNALDMSNGLGGYLAAKELNIAVGNNVLNEGELIGESIFLRADGMHNGGNIYADTMSVHLNHALTNENMISVFNTFDLSSSELTNGSGATLEATNMNLNLSSSAVNQGTLHASALSIVTPILTNASNIIADTLSIDGADVTNNGLLKGDTSTRITVSNSITNNGGIIGGNQLTLHANTITNNEVLYSANAIDLSAADTLRNTQGSSILSDGMISIHDTGTLSNEAATIQSGGDIIIQTAALENLSSTTPTKSSFSSSVGICDYFAPDFRDWKTTNTTTETISKTGYTPAYILSGVNMLIDAATHNRYSMIAANGDLYLSGSLNNEAALDAHEIININHYVEHWEKHGRWSNYAWYHNYSYYENSDTIVDHAYSTIQAGENIYGNLISINNADVVAGMPVVSFSSHTIPTSPTISAITVHDIAYTLPSGNYGQFVTASNPAHPYLIESNPLYTNYNTFIGSDYIMSRLNLNMAADTKRLGDARYETQLVHDAVFRLTGERYLAGFGSDTAEYKALMDNALAVSSDLHLALGVSLSAAQVAALNKDIVWMEERIVAGQKVLVPVVYLASLKTAELSGGGKIIAGGDMQLSVTNGLNNAGEIRARGTLIAVADSIANMGGSLKSTGNMLLRATNDITNTSGTIRGNNVALISDNGNIISKTALKSIDLSNRAGISGNLSTVGEQASIQATGDMLLHAKNDITITGGSTSSGGNTTLTSTTGNVTLASLEQNSHTKTSWSQGSSEIESVKQHATTVNATGDVSINSAKDVTLTSSSIEGKNVALVAGGNVAITAANDREFIDIQTHNKSTFSSSSKRDMTLKESVSSSAITGENISITSGGDTTLQAANLKAVQNIQVDATGDINVIAKQYRQAEIHEEHKSSLGGLSKSVSIDQLDNLNLQAATLKTEAQNIVLTSGKDINIIASKIDSAADVQLKAFENLLIAAGEEQSSQKHVREKTSFNIAGTVGMATGAIGLDTGSLYTQTIHKDDTYNTTAKSSSITAGRNITADTGSTTIIGSSLDATNDVSIKADIGGINVLTSQELSNASTLDKKTEIKLVNLKEMIQGEIDRTKESLNPDGSSNTKVKVKIASATFDESEGHSSAVHNASSNITSHNGSVKLDSSDDIAITGSNITAADTIDLKSATGNITIQEATNSQTTDSKEKHASAQISGTVENEYVEIGSAIKAALESAKQLKKVKEDYSNYKRSVKELESTLSTIKQQYKDKVPGVDYADIEDMNEIISNTKDDQKYYIAAVAAATADLASKTVAIVTQAATAAASSGTWGFSVGMQLDMKGSKTTTSGQDTQALASNVSANTITIQTETSTPTNVTISGSNIVANDTLNITTHDLDVHASTDTTASKSDTKDLSGSLSVTMYGGGASGATLGYGEQHATRESETNHNSNLYANTMNINVANDANFKGATVRGDEALNVNVGNNLNVESVRDSSTSNSNGFNMSAGMTTTGGSNTASATVGTNTGRTLNKQTVLTSLTGDNVNITVGEETHIKGALIAAGGKDENGVFQDNQNLNLITKILIFENSTNTNYSSNSSMSVGINGNKDKVTSASTSFSTGLPSFPMRRVGTRESAKTYLN